MDAIRGIEDFYRKRDADLRYEKDWGYSNRVAAGYFRMRDELVHASAVRLLGLPESQPRILEVGSGYGHELAKFAQLGVSESNLTGVELMPDRVARAGMLYPAIRWIRADARSIPLDDNQFDLTCQYLTVEHGLSRDVQRAMTCEMIRVTRPGGVMVWWDLIPTPLRVIRSRLLRSRAGLRGRARNLSTIATHWLSASARERAVTDSFRVGAHYLNPVPASEIPDLFPGCTIETCRHAGLDWQLWESIWPNAPARAERLFRAGRLAVHAFAIIRKPVTT